GRHAVPLRDHFPSTPVNHQGTEVSDKSHAVITPVGTTIDAIGVFPLYREIIEFVYRGQGVRGFRRVLRISEFPTSRHDGFRRGCLHADQRKIHYVDTPVGHQAAGIIPEPAELKMEPVGIEGTRACRAKPTRIIYAI